MSEDIQDLKKQILKSRVIYDVVKSMSLNVPKAPQVKEPSNSKAEIGILHISDVQFGKVTTTYSSEIAKQRLLALVDITTSIINCRRHAAKIEELRVYLGGDIVEGHTIFGGQQWEIDSSVDQQAIKGAAPALTSMLLGLLGCVQKIKVVCVPGNHGRDGFKSDGSPVNWDNVTYEIIKIMLSSCPRISFAEIGPWFHVDRVFDWGNLLVHGDQIQGGAGGFPFPGTIKKMLGWIDSIQDPWDYMYMGHFHQMASLVVNKRCLLANGSTESDNGYAQKVMAATGSPAQRLAFYTKRHGMIADYPLYLDERKPNS